MRPALKSKLKMTDIKKILEYHAAWVADNTQGRRADLSGANLRGANLRGADLSGADLREADLSGADLREADLREADLRGAYLSEADLSGADLREADLSGADLREADLSGADLSGADLSGAIGLPEVQKFAIDEAVFAACSAPNSLEMGSWHTCETTHCRAGWAVMLHPQGRKLEEKYGTNVAGALIYNACSGYVPDFYASNKDAMKDIVERAIK